jgi:7-cyano-7-deazaguanine synthase
MTDCVAIVSGGLDSTTLAYDLVADGHKPHLLAFDYGQRHSKELQYAQRTATQLKLDFTLVDLRSVTKLISNSALTGDDDVPEGHYAESNMNLTVVPNRNMIMLSIAAGAAVNSKCEFVATGVHAGDHWVYPDCRPRFISSVARTVILGNEGFGAIPTLDDGEAPSDDFIRAPYLTFLKEDIAYRAFQLGVPVHETWSCYKGRSAHCGRCGTCVERLEAIAEAQARYMKETGNLELPDSWQDYTEYEDTEYWKHAISK